MGPISCDDRPKIEIPSDLNQGQAKCYKQLIEFIQQGPGESILLQGYAGTGKTYLITKFIEYIIMTRPNQMIAMTAPTNKAVKVLRRACRIKNQAGISFATIHSLLGLREEITESGDQIFIQGFSDQPNIVNFRFLIIDEVSMLNDDLFHKIIPYANDSYYNIKIIFIGDSAQIPPVMRHDCIPFLAHRRPEFNIRMIELTEIMRQKNGNPIIETASIVRENLMSAALPISRETMQNQAGHGIIHKDTSKEEERESFISMLNFYFTSQEFKHDSDYAKVLAWTNKAVDRMNRLIREMIYVGGPLQRIMIGEKLIANKPIVEISKGIKTILFSTNDEFEVLSHEIKTDKRNFFYYDTIVQETLISGEKVRKTIRILHEESHADFEKKLNEIKLAAMAEKDPTRKKSEWRYYYDFMGSFAQINYNYAISCHKSQGSSYRNTFVLEDDIDQNKKIIERNRIKYTAITRASEKLYLIKRL